MRIPSLQRNLNAIAAGFTALAAYWLFRWYVQQQIVAGGDSGAGLRSMGPLQYDTYYLYSFAQELLRENRHIFFANPFGSLDGAPFLVNGLASALALLHPLWQGDRLALFDLVVSSLSSLLSGFFFGSWMRGISRQGRWPTFFLTQFVLLGGGFGFAAAAISGVERPALLNATHWGLSWTANAISTWELLFHAIFWWGVWGSCTRRSIPTVLAAIFLFCLHPFSLAIYGAWIGMLAIGELCFRSAEGRRLLAWFSLPCLALVAAIYFYHSWLPGRSRDAAYFLSVYQHTPFVIDPTTLVAFFAFPIFFVLIAWLWRDRHAVPNPSRPVRFALLLMAGALLATNFWPLVPQPAHWLRVYPFAFLVAAAATFTPALRPKWLAPAAVILLVIAVADSALSVRSFAVALVGGRGGPALLDSDFAEVLKKIARLPAGQLQILRSCHSPFANSGELEYAASALTPHRVGFGHIFFSPQLREKLKSHAPCSPEEAAPLVAPGAIVLIERSLRAAIPGNPFAETGNWAVFLPSLN